MPREITFETRQRALARVCARLQRKIGALSVQSRRLSWERLGLYLATIAVSLVAASLAQWLGLAILVAGLATFSSLVYIHRRINDSIQRHKLLLNIKSTHLARQQLEWGKIPPPLDHKPDPTHPFEIDLDLTGERSLHHLMDTSVSVGGSRKLMDWLLATEPDNQIIKRRQLLVRELIPLTTFRDKLTLSGKLSTELERRWDASRLLTWLSQPIPEDRLGTIVLVLSALAVCNVVLFVLYANRLIPPLWAISFLVYIGISLTRLQDFMVLFQQANKLHDTLRRVQDVFAHLESYRYGKNHHLKTLCAPFLASNRPSTQLRGLTRVVAAASLQNNVLLWLALNILLPWDLFFAWRLRVLKRELQTQLPVWLDLWYDLEALCALATFAYLNPQYTFPSISPLPDIWQAEDITHPLIPPNQRVANDFAITHLGEVTLITGSNMSGKSTFLRTLGINMVLAYAGGVVTARHLNLSLFRLFTVIRVNDSLADGYSFFYAEVRRLKTLLDALEAQHHLPLFYLIDEIFRGTNNRERFVGSRAYIQALLGKPDSPKHGAGVISTHDLELTKVTDANLRNYHFTDHVENGRMTFDYKLHSGPSPSTNALKIMASEGLPIHTEDDTP